MAQDIWIEDCEKKFGSIRHIYFIESDKVISIPDAVNFLISDPIDTGEESFYQIKLLNQQATLSEVPVKTSSGVLYNVSVKGKFYGDTNDVRTGLEILNNNKFVVIAENASGKRFLIGTPEIPMDFKYSYDTNTRLSDNIVYEIEFSGSYTDPIPYYQSTFIASTGPGESVITPGTLEYALEQIVLINAELETVDDRLVVMEENAGLQAEQIDSLQEQVDLKEDKSDKDTVNGYVGLDSWKIKFRNLANTFTSFFQNAATAARTYTFPDKDITVAGTDDVATALASANAYADSLVVGLWDDRGNFDASAGAYPSGGGSGTAGSIKKGDIWTISVAGTLPTSQVVEPGDVVRALVDSPGNTQSNWSIQQNNLGYTAENSANKTSTVTGNETSTTLYLTVKGYFDYLTGLTWLTDSRLGTWRTGLTEKTTVADNDLFDTSDSTDTNKAKKVSWANIKATLLSYFETIFLKFSSAGYAPISVAGTNTLTFSNSNYSGSAYVTGERHLIRIANTNTGAVTINRNGLGAKSIKKRGGLDLVALDLRVNAIEEIVYDGTDFQLVSSSWTSNNLILMFCSAFSPADSLTYFFTRVVPTLTATDQQINLGIPLTIVGAQISVLNNTIQGSAEDSTLYLRNVTQSSSHIIGTFKTNAAGSSFVETTVFAPSNISVAATDKITLEVRCPAYATNPTSMTINVYLISVKP